jgi:hypothetical protein
MPSLDRRLFLAASAGAVMSTTRPTQAAEKPVLGTGKLTGKGPGDFDFLTGEWRIKLRNFDTSGPGGKKERDASATIYRVMNGMGSIEELRNGDGSMWGMGVRVWHNEEKKWADHWTSAQDGVVNPPQLGQFIDGAGVFLLDDTDEGKPIKIKAVWDQITPQSCRWYQIISRDQGTTWEYGYYMDWTRVS